MVPFYPRMCQALQLAIISFSDVLLSKRKLFYTAIQISFTYCLRLHSDSKVLLRFRLNQEMKADCQNRNIIIIIRNNFLKHAGSTVDVILGTREGIIVNIFCNQDRFTVIKNNSCWRRFSSPQLGFLAWATFARLLLSVWENTLTRDELNTRFNFKQLNLF